MSGWGHREGGGQRGLEYCGSTMLSMEFDEIGFRLGFVFEHIAGVYEILQGVLNL